MEEYTEDITDSMSYGCCLGEFAMDTIDSEMVVKNEPVDPHATSVVDSSREEVARVLFCNLPKPKINESNGLKTNLLAVLVIS